jgi:hypothetical protein
MRTYRLTYEPAPDQDLVVWEKTLEELLVPNGTEPLLVWMLREADQRGLYFALERAEEHVPQSERVFTQPGEVQRSDAPS